MKGIHFIFLLIGLYWISSIAIYKTSNKQIIEINETNSTQKLTKKLLECEHIDILYTWVNGSDPNHIDSRTKRSGNLKYSSPNNTRYRDLMGLKYSLRSIKKFAPWVRNVWVVSASQYPSWFNTSNDEIKFIFHQDYYSNKDDLPTFNSNSIESSFYSLPKEVSNCFIYLNDDIFFGSPVTKNDFYDPVNGHAIYKNKWTAPQPKEKLSNIWHASTAYTNELLNKLWEVDNINRHYATHGHHFFNKEVFQLMYKDLENEFNKTTSKPFRTAEDLQIPFLYLSYLSRFYVTYEPPQINHYSLIMDDLKKMKQEFKKIIKKKPKTVCLNDGLSSKKSSLMVVKELEIFFENYFPDKPTWEI